VDAGRAASKQTGDAMNAMIKGSNNVANAADDAVKGAGAALSKAGANAADDAVKAGANAADDAVKGAGAALSKAGANAADDAVKAGANAADNVAGAAGKELSAADRAAASAAANAARRSGKLSSWIKANPKLAVALGLAGAAAIGAGTVAALSGDEAPAGGEEGGGGGGSTTTGTDTPAGGGSGQGSMPTAPSELTQEQKQLIAQMQKIMSGYRDTEDQELLSHITPADAAIEKVTQSVASTKPATSGQAASPAGSTAGEKRTPAEIQASADLKGMDGVQESSNELARWLRIARG
jgi:hypothetical protein